MECLLFLSTPDSIPSDEIKSQIYSPWVYHEIASTKIISEIIHDCIKKQNRELTKEAAEMLQKSLIFAYNMEFDNLTILDSNTLQNWRRVRYDSPEAALDGL